MLNTQISLPLDTIKTLCAQYAVHKLSVFGSALGDDFKADSDVDMLIEFLPDAGITYFELVDIQDALTQIVGRKVDLLTPNALSPYFREEVLQQAVVIYERG